MSSKAIQLNECARQANVERHRKKIEYTKEWIKTILFPALEEAAANGSYTFVFFIKKSIIQMQL